MKMRHIIIATILYCICLPATAQEVIVKELEGTTVMHTCDLRDLMHTGKVFSGSSKVKQYADADNTVIDYKDRITNMPSYLNDFIEQYVKAAHTVLDGGTSWLSDYTKSTDERIEQSGSSSYYLLSELTDSTDFTFPIGSGGETIKQAAIDAAQVYITPEVDSLDSFMPYAFLTVNLDHPEVFWIGNFFNYGYSYGYKYRYKSSEGTGTVIYTLKFMFVLHDNNSRFDLRNNGFTKYDFRSPANITTGVKLYHSAIQSILGQCQSKSRYKKLRMAYDWITTHNCYNRYHSLGYGPNDLGGMPWSPLSALMGNANTREAPVCEGYARAMKVLCDTMGIPCILMTGEAAPNPATMPVPHMWNYVQMENGKWYAIDPTWDDPIVPNVYKAVSGYESNNWFLLGSTVGSDEGWSFFDSHPEEWAYTFKNEGSIYWEFKDGPELSPLSFNPCDHNGDGILDEKDIQLMAEKLAIGDDDINYDVDENEIISIGDLVRLINRYLSK